MRIIFVVSFLMNQFYFSERYSFFTNLGGDLATTVPSSTSARGQMSESDISTIHKKRMQWRQISNMETVWAKLQEIVVMIYACKM